MQYTFLNDLLFNCKKTKKGYLFYKVKREREMGPLLALVFPCFRENVNVTCKIVTFLYSLDNCLLKKVIVLFFFLEIKFQNGAHLKKGLFLTYFSHFLVTREKTQRILQLSHLHTYTYFAHPIDFLFFCFLFLFFAFPILQKLRIYHVWFLFGMTPGIDSLSRHFGASINNKMVSKI